MYSRKNKSWDLSLTGNWNSVSDDGVTQNRTWDTNQLLTTSTSQVNQNYTYDKRGNQTTRPNSSALQLLKWDIDGHLQSISIGKETKALYTYDALGRRLKKTTYDDAGTASYRLYIRSGQRVLEEYKSTNDTSYSIDRRYIYGSYIDDVIGFYRGSYQFLYHHSDRQYNSRALTDWAKRAIEYTSYTPYGSRIIDTRWHGKNRTTSAYGNTLGFTGRHYEKESGLYYFRARYYDSSQGRFISRDPAGYIDGMGLYNGYFASRFMMDPSGRVTIGSSAASGLLIRMQEDTLRMENDMFVKAQRAERDSISCCAGKYLARKGLRKQRSFRQSFGTFPGVPATAPGSLVSSVTFNIGGLEVTYSSSTQYILTNASIDYGYFLEETRNEYYCCSLGSTPSGLSVSNGLCKLEKTLSTDYDIIINNRVLGHIIIGGSDTGNINLTGLGLGRFG